MHQILCIGEIVNTHGVRGELKVVPLVDDVATFSTLDSVIIDNNTFSIDSVRFHKNMVLVKLKEVNDMNDAEKLKGKFLEVDRDDLGELEEGQYYICDIVGLKVIDENIGDIGIISDVQETGSNDVYITNYMGKPLCIPALDDVILEVNLTDGYMKVKLPNGLI